MEGIINTTWLKIAAKPMVMLFLGLVLNGYGQVAPARSRAWTLVWSDEFNGRNGSAPDSRKWVLQTGGGGWGNNELQYYTTRPQNAQIENGNLVITAWKESYTGPDSVTRNYTSARLMTLGKFAQTYGRFEARIKIPHGQGIWPTFWLVGSNISRVGWPSCGEIDIMENIGKEPSTVHGTIHGPGYVHKGIGSIFSLPSYEHFANQYHIFALEWGPGAIRFYVDNNLYATRTPAGLPRSAPWVFNHPFYIILNVAVGGKYPGDPDYTTVFPQSMMVDYVRAYR